MLLSLCILLPSNALAASAPVITSQPANRTVLAGTNVVLSVTATGSLPLSYQWYLNDIPVNDATNSALAISSIQPSDAGTYSLLVSNEVGVTSCSNVITLVPCIITAQPKNQVSLLGAQASFTVSVTALAPLGYQWQFNNQDLSNATSSTLNLTNLQLAQAGKYSVILSNKFGTLSSTQANLLVREIAPWGFPVQGETNVPPSATNIVGLAAGEWHFLALRADGSVVAWGGNELHQTEVPAQAGPFISVVGGKFHSLGLKADGTVVPWGDTTVSRLPVNATNIGYLAAGPSGLQALAVRKDGTLVMWADIFYKASLRAPLPTGRFVSAAVGAFHCLALRGDGTVVAWGDNAYGQTNVPVSATNIVAISAGHSHNLALRADGTMVAWGTINSIPFSNATNIVAITSGGDYNVALRRDGSLLAWAWFATSPLPPIPTGYTNMSAIAVSQRCSIAALALGPPALAPELTSRTALAGATTYLRIAAVGARPMTYQWTFNGTNLPGATREVLTLSNLGLDQAGSYAVTVSNALGVVTSPDFTLDLIPLEFTGQPLSQTNYSGAAITLTAPVGSALPLTYQWRLNGNDIEGATNASLVFTNAQVTDSGTYSVVVSNSLATLTSSNATLTVVPILLTARPANLQTFKGATATLSVAAQAKLPLSYQWFFNGAPLTGETSNTLTLTNVQYINTGAYTVALTDGSSQTNTAEALLTVLPVANWRYGSKAYDMPAETNIISIAGGENHRLALKSDHTVISWGVNYPAVPPQLTNVVAIAAGTEHSLALTADGLVHAWGSNTMGQLDLPASLTNVVAISAGPFFNLALKGDGGVSAWGDNRSGQITVPTGLTNVIAISAGDSHSLALMSDGTVAAWGAGTNVGSIPDWGQSMVPPGLNNVVGIAAGGLHSLALLRDGKVVGWGGNYLGETTIPTNLNNVVAISAGSYYQSFALKADGTVASWGNPNIPPPLNLTNVLSIEGCGAGGMALVGEGPPPPLPFLLENSRSSGTEISFSWPAKSGRVYQPCYKDAFTDPEWKTLPLSAGAGPIMFLDHSTNSQRVFRVREW